MSSSHSVGSGGTKVFAESQELTNLNLKRGRYIHSGLLCPYRLELIWKFERTIIHIGVSLLTSIIVYGVPWIKCKQLNRKLFEILVQHSTTNSVASLPRFRYEVIVGMMADQLIAWCVNILFGVM